MAIITRPTKTGGGTDVVAGNDLLASEWNGVLNDFKEGRRYIGNFFHKDFFKVCTCIYCY